MSEPNLLELTVSRANTASVNVTTVEQVIIPDPESGNVVVPTGHLYAVDAVYAANVHASSPGYATLKHYKGGSPASVVFLAKKRLISIKSMVNLLGGKPLYVGEGDYVTIKAELNGTLDADAPYADMTDL